MAFYSYIIDVTNMKKALITGVTGQDGSFLAELLLKKGYEVYGIQRRASTSNTKNIDHIFDNPKFPNFCTVYGDLADGPTLTRIIEQIRPDEIYNLGAQSHVRISFDLPEYTANITGLGALRMLEAIRHLKLPAKYYQASSSEMFGKVLTVPQNETTPFNPQSPYGISKTFAFFITRCYRQSYDIFASNGILFNHESERRGLNFVTRKITLGLARVKLGLQPTLQLGNLDAKRDWGHSRDYVEAIWRILQHKKPDDFVIATGQTHTVREFTEAVGKHLDVDIVWKGKGLAEKGLDRKSGKTIIEVNKMYFRPLEVDLLKGNAAKARRVLGWKPKIAFKELVKIMTEHDLGVAELEKKLGKKIEIHNPF